MRITFFVFILTATSTIASIVSKWGYESQAGTISLYSRTTQDSVVARPSYAEVGADNSSSRSVRLKGTISYSYTDGGRPTSGTARIDVYVRPNAQKEVLWSHGSSNIDVTTVSLQTIN
jgi:hypothetical protein